MSTTAFLDPLYHALIQGDRTAARAVIAQAGQAAQSPTDVVADLFWPVYQQLESHFRDDVIPALPHHCAIRLLRVLVDQFAASLPHQPPTGRSVLAFCGPSDADELGAQMAVDLIEAAGFSVTFAGGGIANDEILARIHADQPDFLLLFSSAAHDLPHIRALIDTLREIDACPDMRIIAGGGVFNRAEGLAEEIGADAWAADPIEAVELLTFPWEERPSAQQRTPKARKRRAA